jgi:hypothetical protein
MILGATQLPHQLSANMLDVETLQRARDIGWVFAYSPARRLPRHGGLGLLVLGKPDAIASRSS